MTLLKKLGLRRLGKEWDDPSSYKIYLLDYTKPPTTLQCIVVNFVTERQNLTHTSLQINMF